ncbi:TPA: hypothetical protein ENS27_12645 [bacterium]|nr:hypothetical protein [bacterium]
MEHKPNIGILGGGGILGAHAPAYMKIRDKCNVIKVAEPNPARIEVIHQLLGTDVQIVQDYHAVRRSAPYTHLTHTKDAITFFTDKGYRRQTVPAGMGALDWEAILPILAEYSPDLPLSIEDHKWFFDYNVFMSDWLSFHPDLTCEEFAKVIKITWKCQKRIINGDLPDPDEYEKIPYIDQLEERLCMGRDYLKSVINRHNLVNVNKI